MPQGEFTRTGSGDQSFAITSPSARIDGTPWLIHTAMDKLGAHTRRRAFLHRWSCRRKKIRRVLNTWLQCWILESARFPFPLHQPHKRARIVIDRAPLYRFAQLFAVEHFRLPSWSRVIHRALALFLRAHDPFFLGLSESFDPKTSYLVLSFFTVVELLHEDRKVGSTEVTKRSAQRITKSRTRLVESLV